MEGTKKKKKKTGVTKEPFEEQDGGRLCMCTNNILKVNQKFRLCKFSWVTGTIFHHDQIADMQSEHNFTNSEIFDSKPAQLMSFGIKRNSSTGHCLWLISV